MGPPSIQAATCHTAPARSILIPDDVLGDGQRAGPAWRDDVEQVKRDSGIASDHEVHLEPPARNRPHLGTHPWAALDREVGGIERWN